MKLASFFGEIEEYSAKYVSVTQGGWYGTGRLAQQLWQFGDLFHEPFIEDDGDGYSNFEEYRAGSDEAGEGGISLPG